MSGTYQLTIGSVWVILRNAQAMEAHADLRQLANQHSQAQAGACAGCGADKAKAARRAEKILTDALARIVQLTPAQLADILGWLKLPRDTRVIYQGKTLNP